MQGKINSLGNFYKIHKRFKIRDYKFLIEHKMWCNNLIHNFSPKNQRLRCLMMMLLKFKIFSFRDLMRAHLSILG